MNTQMTHSEGSPEGSYHSQPFSAVTPLLIHKVAIHFVPLRIGQPEWRVRPTSVLLSGPRYEKNAA